MRNPITRRTSVAALALTFAASAAWFAPRALAAPDKKDKPVEVNIKNLTFIPDPVTIKVGQSVKWTNNDDRDYVIVGRNDDNLKSPNLRPKESFTYKFKEAGQIEYFDMLHPRVQGTVIVEDK